MRKMGALPYQMLADMVQSGQISGLPSSKNIQPASIDVTLSHECYTVSGAFLPKPHESVRTLMTMWDARIHDIAQPLLCNTTYLFRLNERFDLPQSVYGYANPKSTTGRHDVHVRIIADGVSRYDSVTPAGFSGELWAFVTPRSYAVKVFDGLPVSQVRLFNRDTRFTETEMEILYGKHQFLYSRDGVAIPYNKIPVSDRDGTLILSIDLEDELIGYMAIDMNVPFDFASRPGTVDPNLYFRPIRTSSKQFILQKDRFYILSTKERIVVPPEFACEVVDMDSRSGDFRTHYAGFFDPGWGYGTEGSECGRQATLEVRPYEHLCLTDGQPIARFRYERMIEAPEVHYDLGAPNYREQVGPKLAKHFIVK